MADHLDTLRDAASHPGVPPHIQQAAAWACEEVARLRHVLDMSGRLATQVRDAARDALAEEESRG